MSTPNIELHIGKVIKPHGIKGEVVVEPTTDNPVERFAVGAVLAGKQGSKEHLLTVKSMRPHQKRLLLAFEEIPDRTAADTLRGTQFFASPEFDGDDEGFYDHELEGLRVLNCGAVDEDSATRRAYEGQSPEPEDIGVVSGVSHGPAGTTLEITLDYDASHPARGSVVLLPFKHAMVPIVDIDNGALVITPPKGLLEVNI